MLQKLLQSVAFAFVLLRVLFHVVYSGFGLFARDSTIFGQNGNLLARCTTHFFHLSLIRERERGGGEADGWEWGGRKREGTRRRRGRGRGGAEEEEGERGRNGGPECGSGSV